MPQFDWKRWPEAEELVASFVTEAIEGNAFARDLSGRMQTVSSTRFIDWVDHFTASADDALVARMESVGFQREIGEEIGPMIVFEHTGGMFPRIVLDEHQAPRARISAVALKVESIADFSRAHDLGLEIKGYPLGPYRSAEAGSGDVKLEVVERRGYRGFDPWPGPLARKGLLAPHAARETLAAAEIWKGRKRAFDDDEQGFEAAESALERVIERAGGVDLACHLVFEAEREYWTSRNRAARVQKTRQDRLGLGWANHDHHTFRSSRKFFPRLIGIFEKLGFELRERFHAGSHAGWARRSSRIGQPESSYSQIWTSHRTRRITILPRLPCRTCPGPTPSGFGWVYMGNRSCRLECIIWRLNSILKP